MYYRSSDGCGSVLAFLILIALAFFIVVYLILPITLFVIGSVAVTGAVSGAVVAVKNFKEVLVEAHQTIR